MSTLTGESRTAASDPGLDRTRRWVSLVAALVVLAWSVAELVNLVQRHTIGAELYGVLVAALAVVAGIGTVALLALGRRRVVASVAVIVLWGVVALGGVAGTIAHVVGPAPGHGPVDTRPRPVPAPLVFTALGIIGGTTLLLGQRLGTRRRTA